MYNPAEEISSISFDKIIGGTLNAVVTAQNNSSMTSVEFIKSVGFENDANGKPVKPVYVDFKYPKEVSPYQPAVPDSAYVTIVDGGESYDGEDLSNVQVTAGGYTLHLKLTVNTAGAVCGAEILDGIEDASKIGEDVKFDLEHTSSDKDAKKASLKLCKRTGHDAVPAVYQDMVLQVPILTIVPVPFIRVATTDIELNVKINSINTSEDSSSTNSYAGTTGSASYNGLFVKGNISMNASIAHQKKSSSTEEIKKEYSLNIKIHAVQDDVPAGLGRVLDILEESIVPKKSSEAA